MFSLIIVKVVANRLADKTVKKAHVSNGLYLFPISNNISLLSKKKKKKTTIKFWKCPHFSSDMWETNSILYTCIFTIFHSWFIFSIFLEPITFFLCRYFLSRTYFLIVGVVDVLLTLRKSFPWIQLFYSPNSLKFYV